MTAPVWIQVGHPDNSVTVFLGYGRRRAGRVGTGAGFDMYRLRTSATPWVASGVAIRKTGGTYKLASTQGYQTMETPTGTRPLVRTASFEEYRKEPDFAREEEPPKELTLYKPYPYAAEPYAWGMTVDMNACVGCNNCIVACQSENNIPVVGKEQTVLGRHMHWLRVDSYYQGDRDNPKAYFQPVPCQQCENAPCEVVCPVGATVHSSEGLNDMVYNRCVGTRYCSDNCPYKVRRFNFLLFQDWETSQYKMMRNPDVTVRSRGVMEKCTYCVQRINQHRIDSEREDRKIQDGELQTACQQSCPADAIVFGNINDPNSRVSKLKAQPRNYSLLADLNTRPRTTYLADIRNPNPELEAVKDRSGASRSWQITSRRRARTSHRTRPHLRFGHGQDQLDRADSSHVERLVHRFWHRLPADDDAAVRHLLPVRERGGHLGRHHSHRLGIRHRQLRLVDRNRARRHVDFRHPAFAAAVVAQLDQPFCRSHDAVCRRQRGNFPPDPRRTSLACLLAVSLSQHHECTGRSSAARWCGTFSRSPLTPPSRRCSGSSA